MIEVLLETEDEHQERDRESGTGEADCRCGCGSGDCEECSPDETAERVRYFPGHVSFVNVYRVERCYGGPEEGGWWYNAGVLEEVHALPNEASAKAKAESLSMGVYSNEGEPGLGSTASQGEWQVEVSDRPGRHHWPRVRPCYE